MIVDLGAKNESSSRIDVVTAAVYENIHWKAGGHSDKSDRKIASTMFRITEKMRAMNKESMRGIQQQHRRSGVRAGETSNDICREILNAVRDGANQVNLQTPLNAKKSYNGNLITVSHRLSIKVKTPSCVSDPEIIVPLQIVTQTSSASMATSDTIPISNSYPEGWNTGNVTDMPVVQASYVGLAGEQDYLVNPATNVVPSAPLLPDSNEYTLSKLLEKLDTSLSIKLELEKLLRDPQWKSIIAPMKPYEFDSILQKVTLDFDKVDVSNLLFPHIQNFTCIYAVAILRSVSNFLRIQFIQAMLPHIVDLSANNSVLLKELSEWEKVCSERDFENALARGS